MPVTSASYVIKVRDSNLNLIGEIDAYDSFDMISRYNNVGSWALTLADDHPMAQYLVTPGYGIYVLRNGAYYFSGPVRYIDHKGIASNSLTVVGFDDMFWLATREAYFDLNYTGSVTTYTETLLYAAVSTTNCVRLYSFGDTSGTTAVDQSGALQNGTYTGTVTFSQPTGLDDPALTTLFGSNGWVSVPNAGITGNQGFAFSVWFNYTGAPAATSILAFSGTWASASSAYIGILTTGKPTMQVKGVNTSSTTALANGWHHMCLNYDGTTAKLWVDGTNVASVAPGTCTMSNVTTSFGAGGAGVSNFSTYAMAYGTMYQGGPLGNASLSGSPLNGLPWPQVLYGLGKSLFSIATYDSQTGPAETVIKHYVDRNCVTVKTQRVIPGLSIQADAATGSTVTYNARFEQLMQSDFNGLLQILAAAGGVGMKIIQSGTGLIFQVFVPALQSNALFSIGMGNLGAYESINDSQALVNYVVVAGGGTGVNRAYYQTGDATSIGLWGRSEGFVNAGTTTDPAQLATQAAAALANGASKLTFTAEFYETDGCQYVRDYNLGDKVTVVVDGATLTDIVREVQISLKPSSAEVLTVGIGTPASGQILFAMQKYQQMIAALNTRVTFLERV